MQRFAQHFQTHRSPILTSSKCTSHLFANRLRFSSSAATHKPLAPATASIYSQLEGRFQQLSKSLNGDALSILRSLPPARHAVVLIGGDQCTGKSTLSKRIAAEIGGKAFSAGQLFRNKAKEMAITSAELSRRALVDPNIDVGIEFELCKLICTGDPSGPLIIEGRQPAVMDHFLRTTLGRSAAFRLRLTCSILEQALRFIEREYGPEVKQSVLIHLPQVRGVDGVSEPVGAASVTSPAQIGVEIGTAPLSPIESKVPVFTKLSELTPVLEHIRRPEMAHIIHMFKDNDSRDEDDRKRFQTLYGTSEYLDHSCPELYDEIIDTTLNESSDTFEQAMYILTRHIHSSTSIPAQAKEKIPTYPDIVKRLHQQTLQAKL